MPHTAPEFERFNILKWIHREWMRSVNRVVDMRRPGTEIDKVFIFPIDLLDKKGEEGKVE